MDLKKILDKLCNRVERDVAVAGAMVGSVAAMEKLFPTIEHFTTLKLYLPGGRWTSWDCWSDDGKPPPSPFSDFLRWYHGRPQSACYVMRHKEGANMVRRCDILAYDLINGERVKGKK